MTTAMDKTVEVSQAARDDLYDAIALAVPELGTSFSSADERGDAINDAIDEILPCLSSTQPEAALREAVERIEQLEPPLIEQVYYVSGINADGGPPWHWYVSGPEGEVAYCQTENGEEHANMIAAALNDRVQQLREPEENTPAGIARAALKDHRHG